MAHKYFISYRRKAGGDVPAREVYNILCKYVGKDNVFFDRESIGEGSWRKYLEKSLQSTGHFILIVNEASASDVDSVYYEEISYALKNDNLKADLGRITVIVYDNGSYKKLLANFPDLESRNIQKVTYNGEYGSHFEERLCKHFNFNKRFGKWWWLLLIVVIGGGAAFLVIPTNPNNEDTNEGTNTTDTTENSWPYGQWTGGTKNGKPHGSNVTVIYSAECLYNSTDPLKRKTKPGQKVVGMYEEGMLIIGDIYDENNNLIEQNFEPKM